MVSLRLECVERIRLAAFEEARPWDQAAKETDPTSEGTCSGDNSTSFQEDLTKYRLAMQNYSFTGGTGTLRVTPI